jgi:hypothetical protein
VVSGLLAPLAGAGRHNPGLVSRIDLGNTHQIMERDTSEDEIRAWAKQYVRKISGLAHPSAANKEPFDRAVDEIATTSSTLLGSLVTAAPPRNREKEAAKARIRAMRRSNP